MIAIKEGTKDMTHIHERTETYGSHFYDFNWDYFICNIYDSNLHFINIASNLSDVINANVAQIYTSVL